MREERLDPDAFERSGPMGYKDAVHCVSAEQVEADGLVRFGSVVFENIGHRASLYLDAADVPAPFRGTAIALITAGIMSLAFMGFAGMARP